MFLISQYVISSLPVAISRISNKGLDPYLETCMGQVGAK